MLKLWILNSKYSLILSSFNYFASFANNIMCRQTKIHLKKKNVFNMVQLMIFFCDKFSPFCESF
jgi:hypothetical protein